MQSVKVNRKVFRSIRGAAKFLGVSLPWLSTQLKHKQAITHKDLLIEKIEKPTKPVRQYTRKVKPCSIPVIVDGVAYNSCSEAEKAVGLAPCVLSKALRCQQRVCCGHTLEPVYPSMVKPTEKRVKVFCETTGVTYNSITEIANKLGVNDWTMSKKMEASGAFIDKNGNVYKRLEPMKTKNQYKNTGSTIKTQRPFAHRTVVKHEEPVTAQVVETPVVEKPVEIAKPEVPQIVKDAINDKIIALLKENGVYDDIIALLEYGGFTSVKFNPKQNG